MALPEGINTNLVITLALDSPSGSVERIVGFEGERARQIWFLLSALLDQLKLPSAQGKGGGQ